MSVGGLSDSSALFRPSFFVLQEVLIVTQNFSECYEILSNMYEEINGEAFYRYIFPNNENSNEKHMDYSMPKAFAWLVV